MKSIFSVFILGFSVFLFSCQQGTDPAEDDPDQNLRELSPAEEKIVQASQSFGLDLFRRINAEQPDENVFISPLSVSMALGMALNGAAGPTYDEMRMTLDFAGLTEAEINTAYQDLISFLSGLDEDVLFEIANSIWYRNTAQVESSFLQTNRDYFNADVAGLDFSDPASVTVINNWVSDKTHQKIETIIDTIDPMTVMFLINAIYFKGTWTWEFDPDNTLDDLFYRTPQETLPCRMMRIEGVFSHYQDEHVQIVDLPYGNGQYSMTIVLPQADPDVNRFIRDLSEEQWKTYLHSLSQDSGIVQLPKFKFEYEYVLNDVLKAMGMGIAFTEDADFSRISTTSDLYIFMVKHKSFVQTDEQGTEAAAVTIIEFGTTSAGPPQPEIFVMRMDRPFFFVIREHHSNALLFMGKIDRPDWEE